MTDLNALISANGESCLTQADLRKLLHYSPETGDFRWIEITSNRAKAKELAGTTSCGYIQIQIRGRRYLAHRLAWLYMTGVWPNSQVDHKDRCRFNNKWINLREATNAQNSHNSIVKASSKTGFKGVSFIPKAGLFTARIRYGGKRISLGCYRTAEEASRAYAEKSLELHGEFARVA